ncbi:MAG: aminotransferase class IV family protein, partial [Micromonosporaceae bacterium]
MLARNIDDMIELNGRSASAEDLLPLALSNYGHFTSMRVADMRVRGLALHLDRLARDSQALFGAGLDLDRVRHLIRRGAAAGPVVRVTGYDPGLDIGRPVAAGEPQMLVTAHAANPGELPPVRLATVRHTRAIPEVKHVGLLSTVHHRRQSQLAGFDDVLFVDSQSRVSEGATWNIGFVGGGRVVWPDAPCLEGVTMRLLDGILRQAGIPSETVAVDPGDLSRFRSGFITNAVIGLRPVAAIDDQAYPEDVALLSLLRERYAAMPGDPL